MAVGLDDIKKIVKRDVNTIDECLSCFEETQKLLEDNMDNTIQLCGRSGVIAVLQDLKIWKDGIVEIKQKTINAEKLDSLEKQANQSNGTKTGRWFRKLFKKSMDMIDECDFITFVNIKTICEKNCASLQDYENLVTELHNFLNSNWRNTRGFGGPDGVAKILKTLESVQLIFPTLFNKTATFSDLKKIADNSFDSGVEKVDNMISDLGLKIAECYVTELTEDSNKLGKILGITKTSVASPESKKE